MATWAPMLASMKNRLVDQIHRLLSAGGDRPTEDDLELDPATLVPDLLHAMTQAGTAAAHRVVEEARDQGIHLHPAAAAAERDHAHAAAEQVTIRLRRTAGRAVEQAAEDATPDQIVEAARTALAEYGDAGPEQLAGNTMHGAMTTARLDTYRQGPVGAIYASEVNDSHTCQPCHLIDGKWLGNTDQMAQVELAYPGGAYGGYVGCLGFSNCRGTITGVWRQGTEATPVEPGPKGHSLQGSIASGIASERQLGGGQEARTDLVTFNDGTRAVRKVGKQYLGTSPADMANAEELAAVFGQRAGVLVPEVVRVDRDTVYMAYVDAPTGAEAFHVPYGTRIDENPQAAELIDSAQGRRLGLFDVTMGNSDRNDGNWLVDNGQLVGIDHGAAWSYLTASPAHMEYATGPNDFVRRMLNLDEDGTVTGSRDYSRADVEHLRQALAGMEQEFTRLRRHAWFVNAMARLDVLEQYAGGDGSVF